MKKIVAFSAAVIMLLSFTACEDEPHVLSEDVSGLEVSEPEKPDKDALYEEIILNFGARKDEDEKYRAEGDFSFYRSESGYENFHDFGMDDDVLYGIGSMLGEEELKEFTVGNGKIEAFPGDVFEETAYKYFGISAEALRNTIHYCEENGEGCYYPFGMVYNEEDPEIIVENIIENEDAITFYLNIDYKNNANDASAVLSVKLLPDGGYNYVSYSVEKTGEPEQEKTNSMTFKLGSDGETVELSPNDSLGEWVLIKLDVDYYSEANMTDSLDAEFSGNVELKGHIERNVMSEYAYDFVIDKSEYDRMPWLVSDEFKAFRGRFIMDIPEGLENAPNLTWDEVLPCKITIVNYRISCAYTETADTADVIKIEPLSEEMPALYEDMILNFGAEYNHEGKLSVKKGMSLYNNREGYMDCSLMGMGSYYSWVMSRTSTEDRIEVELPGFAVKVYAYDAEFFEKMVFEYFETPAEYLRKSEYYYPNQNCYFIDGHGGIGDTTYITYLFAEEKDDRVIIYLSLYDSYYGTGKYALTVKLLPDGGYNYVSYLPE